LLAQEDDILMSYNPHSYDPIFFYIIAI